MTTCPEDLRDWSAIQLGAATDAAPGDVRRAFLCGVANEDFVPPETWKPALAVLLDRGDDASRWALEQTFLQESEEALAAQVETFAAEFSDLEPAERRRRYDALASRVVRIPRLAARLRRLEKGLDVPRNWDHGLDPNVKVVARHLWSLFLLPPVEAARRRQEFLAAAAADVPRWEAAARELSRSRLAVATLDSSGVMQELLEASAKVVQRTWRETQRRTARAKPAAAAPAPEPASSSFPRAKGVLFVLISGGLIRLAMSFGGSGTPATHSPRFEPVRDVKFPDATNWPQMPDPNRMKEVNDLLNKPFDQLVDENKKDPQKAAKRLQDLVDQVNRTRARNGEPPLNLGEFAPPAERVPKEPVPKERAPAGPPGRNADDDQP